MLRRLQRKTACLRWEKAEVLRSIFNRYLEGTDRERCLECVSESHLTNMKYTGDAGIGFQGKENRYKPGGHHTRIISREIFEEVQIERAMHSNMKMTEEGWKRSKRKK